MGETSGAYESAHQECEGKKCIFLKIKLLIFPQGWFITKIKYFQRLEEEKNRSEQTKPHQLKTCSQKKIYNAKKKIGSVIKKKKDSAHFQPIVRPFLFA